MTRFGVILLCQKSSEDVPQTSCLPDVYSTMMECITAVRKLDIVENSITRPCFFKILKNSVIVEDIVTPPDGRLYGFLRLSEDLRIVCCSPELHPHLATVILQASEMYPRSDTAAYFKILTDDEIVCELHVKYNV